MAENIIAFVIILMVALIMIAIGISQIKSKEPTGFYTFEKTFKKEEISNVELWNKKHGMMWILYGAAMIGTYVIAGLVGDATLAYILTSGIIVVPIPVMMWYHGYLKKQMKI